MIVDAPPLPLLTLLRLSLLALRLDLLARYPELLETHMATPKLQGLTKAMDMLEHDLEVGAEQLMVKIGTVGARGKAAYAKGHERIDDVAGRVGQVEKFVAAVEGSNGGDPLDKSSNSSGAGSHPTTGATVPPPNNLA